MSCTPRLRATLWRFATPLREGATPVARQSRFHGVPRLGVIVRRASAASLWESLA